MEVRTRTTIDDGDTKEYKHTNTQTEYRYLDYSTPLPQPVKALYQRPQRRQCPDLTGSSLPSRGWSIAVGLFLLTVSAGIKLSI
jgi:hypothetical protein